MPKKSRFREPFDKQRAKSAQAMLKSLSQTFYHIFQSLQKESELEKVSLIDIPNVGTPR